MSKSKMKKMFKNNNKNRSKSLNQYYTLINSLAILKINRSNLQNYQYTQAANLNLNRVKANRIKNMCHSLRYKSSKKLMT